jgi:phospho-N-acetylmuramoyl-pentapeptide-transferase
MSEGIKLLVYFIGAAGISAAFGPLVVFLTKKLKARQTVLGYVTQHENKTGTPTMGGFIFLLPPLIFSLIEMSALSVLSLSVTLGFAVLGFLDDFIKIHFHRNLGLKAYQKIIGQVGLALAVGFFCYRSDAVGTAINLPFTDVTLDLGWGIIPFTMVVFIATTNSVNLTDGLDGLAGYTSLAYFLCFSLLLFFVYGDAVESGNTAYAAEAAGLAAFSVSMLGGLCGYLLFNGYPASIMMGDTGSLALGAAAASVACFSKNPLLIVSAGIMFVWSSISVILQVCYFKLTKKRIFLMAPFHHHLEMKGLHENKIVGLYFFITLAAGAFTIISARAI